MTYEDYKKLRDLGYSHEEAGSRTQQGLSSPSFRELPGNILPSAGRAISNIFEAGVNVFNPDPTKNTVANLLQIGAGAVSKVIPGRQRSEEAFDAVGQFLKDRYGSPERLKKTLVEDPVGLAADLATVVTGGAGLARVGARLAGGAATAVGATEAAGALGRAGEIAAQVGRAGQAIDPFVAASRAAGAVGRRVLPATGRAISEGLGMTTGTGSAAIRQAIRGGEEFTNALRGAVSEQQVVNTAVDALDAVKALRAADYQNSLMNVAQQTQRLDLTPLNQVMKQQLDKFNVRYNPTDGTFDFSRSTIADGAEAARVKGIVETIADWGSQRGDLTPIMVDTLKRRLGDFYSPSREASAFLQPIKAEVRTILQKNVPGYAKMTENYAKLSDDIDEIRRLVSEKAAPETIFKRLLASMKEGNDIRLELLNKMNEFGQTDIVAQVAGVAMNQWIPRGALGKVAAGGAGIGLTVSGVGALMSMALALGVSSPRLIGEILRAIGVPAKQIPRMLELYADLARKGVPRIISQAQQASEAAGGTMEGNVPEAITEQSTEQPMTGVEQPITETEQPIPGATQPMTE